MHIAMRPRLHLEPLRQPLQVLHDNRLAVNRNSHERVLHVPLETAHNDAGRRAAARGVAHAEREALGVAIGLRDAHLVPAPHSRMQLRIRSRQCASANPMPRTYTTPAMVTCSSSVGPRAPACDSCPSSVPSTCAQGDRYANIPWVRATGSANRSAPSHLGPRELERRRHRRHVRLRADTAQRPTRHPYGKCMSPCARTPSPRGKAPRPRTQPGTCTAGHVTHAGLHTPNGAPTGKHARLRARTRPR